MTMPTYAVNTTARSYTTTKVLYAAEVACAWKRRGLQPSLYLLRNDGERVSIDEVKITTVHATTRVLRATI